MKSTDKMGQIDLAIAAARQRKASNQGKPSSAPRGAAAEKPARARLSAEERQARDSKREAERQAKKAERDRVRSEKRAAKENGKQKPHLAKVLKAAARLPKLTERTQATFNDVTVNMTAAELLALAAHLQHFNRANATSRAIGQKLEAGTQVRIIGGDARYIGQTGTVFKAQRIRCYVEVAGAKKPVYLFTSDVEVTSNAAKTAANG